MSGRPETSRSQLSAGDGARNRPSSASSRNAWSDDGIDNPAGPRSDYNNRHLYGGSMPAPMENEMYGNGVEVLDNNPPVHVNEPPSGCFYKFTRGIRCKSSTVYKLYVQLSF